MAPKAKQIDLSQVQQQLANGESQEAIARSLGIAQSTLSQHLARAKRVAVPEDVSPSPPEVYQRRSSGSIPPQLAQDLTAAWPDLQDLLAWWRERQRSTQEPSAKLERVTYHVAPAWIEAVRREADLSGESYAAVVNRAFAQYFSHRST